MLDVFTVNYLRKAQRRKFAPMRQSQRRRLLLQARDAGQERVSDVAYKLLSSQYKVLERELRRANLRKRLKKTDGLYKQNDAGKWQWFIDQFNKEVSEALAKEAANLMNIEDEFFAPSGADPKAWNYEQIVEDYQSRIGRKIKRIGEDTLSDVQEAIANWYKTDKSLPQLIQDLEQYFSHYRAKMIAATEMNYLASEVSYQQMQYMGIERWLWDAFADACDICLDLQQQSNAQPFTLNDPMPPDASHPNCRCGVLYANENGQPLTYGETE